MKASVRIRLGALAGAAAVLLVAADAHAWQALINGPVDQYDSAEAVAVDAGGNVVVAGRLQRGRTQSFLQTPFDFFVAKLARKSGYEIWRYVITGGTQIENLARAVTVDAAGDVVVGGNVPGGGQTAGIVVKLSGVDGTELWRHVVVGDGGLFNTFGHVAVDASGDVVAAGGIQVGPYLDIAVVKLAGADGAELWTRMFTTGPGAYSYSGAAALALDAAGNAAVGGMAQNAVFVTMVSGADGGDRWPAPYTIPNLGFGATVSANALAFDASGDVAVAARTFVVGTSQFTVAKLAGADGSQLWRDDIAAESDASSVAVDAAGDVVAGGSYLAFVGRLVLHALVVKYAGTDGHELWRQELDESDGDTNDRFTHVLIAPNGDAIACGGGVQNALERSSFSLARLAGATGDVVWRRAILGTRRGFASACNGVALAGPLVVSAGVTTVKASDVFALGVNAGDGGEVICGNGVVQGSETCDDGNEVETDTCKNDCTPNVCGDGVVRSGVEQCDDGNAVDGDGCESTCVVSPKVVSGTVGPGGTLSSDTESDGATPADPVEVAVTTPSGGGVTVSRTSTAAAPVLGSRLLSGVVQIAAPVETAANPLAIVFRIDASLVAAGQDETTIQVSRDDVAVPSCSGPSGEAAPDPCTSSRARLGDGDVEITVLASSSGAWSFAAPICTPTPRVGCQRAYAKKSQLQIKQKTPATGDRLTWKWVSSADTPLAQFSPPAGSTGYHLCLYDATPTRRLRVSAPAGGVCAGAACWKGSIKSLGYLDRDLTPDGIRTLVLLTGGARGAAITLKGQGPNLGLPTLPLTTPITLQMQSDDGGCWTSTFGVSVTSHPGSLKATAD
jgi:cysteine-rich repeat protein